MNQSVLSFQPLEAPLRERALAVAVVAAAHVALISAWLAQPPGKALPVEEMSVQVIIPADTVQAAVKPEPKRAKPIPEALPEPVRPQPQPKQPEPEAQPTVAEVPAQPAAAPVVNPVAPEVAEVEPDYKAAYLNNPRPHYPMVARRMGLQGKVVLNVEVLDIGQCGQASVFQSSGYAVLDNSALETVKSWRFVPARQGGRAVTKWFKIPINFSLKDSAA